MFKTLLKQLLGRGSIRSYSQFGEDAVVHAHLKNIQHGTYVDVGAYHPHLYSNTYLFYRKGWSGVCIDPNPEMAKLFRIFRPRDTFAMAGVGAGTLTYYQFKDPAYNTFDASRIPEYERNTKLIGNMEVPCYPLQHFTKGLTKIDFLTVDAEGKDADILETYDWSLYPTLIVVEGEEAGAVLTQKGYVLASKVGLSNVWKRAAHS